jgi:hypothetical protein
MLAADEVEVRAMVQTEVELRRTRLAADLDKALKVHGAAGKRHYFSTVGLVMLAAASSIIAGALAFVEADHVIVGILALVPAAATILINSLKLQEKANWYYRKKNELLALYNHLHFELPDPVTSPAISEVSRRWSALNRSMQGDWDTKLTLSVQDVQKGSTKALTAPDAAHPRQP